MTKHEATYGEVAQELKRRTGRGFSAASTESEIKEALLKAKSDSKGDLDIKKTTVKMKSGKEKEIEYVDKVPAGYKKLEGAMTAPLGYTWYHNGKSIIDKDRRTILVKDNEKKQSDSKGEKVADTKILQGGVKESHDEYGRTIFSKKDSNKKVKIHKNGNFYLASYGEELKNDDGYTEFQVFPSASGKSFKTEEGARKWALKQLKADNSKEIDMALLEELKKLITRVENNKENEMEIDNAKVDKRDIIRQIMAIAGKEEASEDVKTIAKLAEKLAYDKSEAGTADNEMDKEDPDDEKKVKEVKEEVKEDVENKCKNSVDNSKTDYFAEMNKIYNAAQEAKKENIYISQAQREQDAVDYFKK